VWFASLAALADSGAVPDSVLRAMFPGTTAGAQPLEQIVEALSADAGLLVADNLEHLLPGGAQFLIALLERAPGLRCLITSRQALQAPGRSAALRGMRASDMVASSCCGKPVARGCRTRASR